MSKKNRLSTRQNAHTYALEREKEAADKRQKKQEKNKALQAARAGAAAALQAGTSDRKMTPGFTPGLQVKKMKRKGIRIRKHAVVRGIRIKDAASKHNARQLLAEEAEERKMAMEGEGAPSKPKKVSVKGMKKSRKLKNAVAAKPKTEEDGMAVD